METESSRKINGRIWLETESGKLIGKGRIDLLERIIETGSIRQAAMQMKMSYKQAWDLVNEMNTGFSQPLVISHRGGKGGGHAQVTDKGLEIILKFKILEQRFFLFLEENKNAFANHL